MSPVGVAGVVTEMVVLTLAEPSSVVVYVMVVVEGDVL